VEGVAALRGGLAGHGLARVDEAAAVVRCIESLLQP
jgi:hypothetical protein